MRPQSSRLESLLHDLDGSGYGGYKRITGHHDIDEFTLVVDRVQADPYASPSRMRVRLPHSAAGFPSDLLGDRTDRIAVADYLLRAGARFLSDGGHPAIDLGRPGQEVLERSNVLIDDDGIELRLFVSLPARGRRILGRAAADILTRALPDLARHLLGFADWPEDWPEETTASAEPGHARHGSDATVTPPTATGLRNHVRLLHDQLELQSRLGEEGLIGFVGNGAILPRRAGDSDLPLTAEAAVPFAAPASMERTFELSSGRRVTGMAIPAGVTVIVGGGYHGKSTILRALERGVYPHVAGDGREWVLADPTAASVRAEDGRAVTGDDISPFITNLPSGTDTGNFGTTNASGSTSQAAGLVESLEAGARTLFIDEDTSATNFMIRDDLMRALIPADREPITPFVERVRPLLDRRGVSTVLVAGGSSAFFDVADHVIALTAYVPADVTERAHELAGVSGEFAGGSAGRGGGAGGSGGGGDADRRGGPDLFADPRPRIPTTRALRPPNKTKSAKAKGLGQIQFGREFIDVSAVAQLVDPQQTNAIAEALEYLAEIFDGRASITDALAEITAMIDAQGVAGLTGHRSHPGHLTRPRAHEIAAALNRFRGLSLAR